MRNGIWYVLVVVLQRAKSIGLLRSFAFLSALTLLACTKDPDRTKIKIQFPTTSGKFISAQSSKKLGQVHATSGWWNPSNPTQLSEINCFGVLVEGAEAGMRSNFCSKSDGSEKFYFGPGAGFVASGREVLVEVPAGAARTIRIVGVHATSAAACVNYRTLNSAQMTELSRPYLLASKTVNLNPGDQTISLDLSFDSTKYFEDCTGPDFQNSGGSPPATHLRLVREEFPYNGVPENSCVRFVAKLTNSAGQSARQSTPTSFGLETPSAPMKLFTNYSDCNNNVGSPMTATIPVNQERTAFYMKTTSASEVATLEYTFMGVSNTALTAVGLTLANKSSSKTTLTFEGPHTLLPNLCYRFQFAHKYFAGWSAGGGFTATVGGTGGAGVYSDASCSTAITTYEVTSMPGPIYIKVAAGSVNPTLTASGGTSDPTVENLTLGSGTTTPVGLQVYGATSGYKDSCSSSPYTVAAVNANGVPVPVTTPITYTPTGAGDFFNEAGCSTAASTTIPAGEYGATFYFRPTQAGEQTLTVTAAGLTPSSQNVTVNGLHRLELTITESGPVSNGTCVEVTLNPKNFDGTAAGFPVATTVSVSPAASIYTSRVGGLCLGSAGGSFSMAQWSNTGVFYALATSATGGAFTIGASASGVLNGAASITVNAPAVLTLAVSGSQIIPSEYGFMLDKVIAMFTGVPSYSYAKLSGSGTLSSGIYTSSNGDSASLQVTDAIAASVTVNTTTVNRSALLDFTSSLPTGVTLSRAASAYYVNNVGALVQAPPNGARFDHDPDPSSGYASLGLLIEGSATNELIFSQDFSIGNWDSGVLSGAPSNAGAPSSPVGSTSGVYKLTDANSNIFNVERVWNTFSAQMTDDVDFIASVYIKADTGSGWAGLMINENGVGAPGTGSSGVIINLANGMVYPMEGPYTPQMKFGHGVQKLSNGWYRIWVKYHSGIYGGAGGQGSIVIFPAHSNSGNLNGDIDATGSVWVWGPQLEVSSSLSSYIPTVSVPVTRPADVVAMPINGTNIPGYAGSGTASFKVRYSNPSGVGGSTGTLFQLCGATCAFDQIAVRRTSNERAQMYFSASMVPQATMTSLPYVKGANNPFALSWADADPVNFSLNGSVEMGPSVNSPNLSGGTLYIGNDVTGNSPSNGHIKYFEYWTQKISAPGLGSATANPNN